MPGLGFGMGRGARRRAGAGVSAPAPATFAMSQLAESDRIYQRETDAGGGEGKGQGTIPVTVEVTGAGAIYARCRSAADGTTILQAPWLVSANVATDVTELDVAGVDARLGWFYLDLSPDGSTWQNGTVPVGMGRLVAFAGQSLQVNMLVKVHDNTTLAALGVSIPANGRVYASWDAGGSNVGIAAWRAITDADTSATVINSAGVTEFLNLQIAASGVNCAAIGHAEGNTAIAVWQPGQSRYSALQATVAGAGGAFESFYWFQGHSDFNSSYHYYVASMDALFAGLATLSSRSFTRYASAYPNVTPSLYGNFAKQAQIRKASADWCADNGATYLGFSDLEMYTDNVHQLQAGSRRIAQHLHRAMRPELGLPVGDEGPVITNVSKSGTAVTLSVALPANATSLVAVGSPEDRFIVSTANEDDGLSLALDATTPIVVGTDSITLNLASDPGEVPLQIWPYGLHPDLDGSASGIYDNSDDGDGIAHGRQLSPGTVPARYRVNTLMTEDSASYGVAKFGNGLTGGRLAAPYVGLVGHPYDGVTFDCWLGVDSLPGGNQVFFGASGVFWVAITSSGDLLCTAGSAPTLTVNGVFSAGNEYHIRVCITPGGRRTLIFINGINVLDDDSAVLAYHTFHSGRNFTIGGLGGSSGYIYNRGWIDEFALFLGVLGTENFTPPTVPWVGDEANLLHLWHMNDDATDSGA